MKTHNAENERIKRRYFAFLKDAMGQSEQTLDSVAKSLARFEEYTKLKDFKAFHYQQAVAFKNHLTEQKGERSGTKLSKATLHATLANLKRFFRWLADKPGYKSRIQYSDADYFNLSEKDVRIATTKREQRIPTLEQVKHVINTMPSEGEIAMRNRALVAFITLTGARDSAVASLRLKHVDLTTGSIYQDAREVSTKFGKTITTYFFPVGDEITHVLVEWVNYLRNEKLWGNDDPLFPATLIRYGESRQFEVAGLNRKPWSNATPIRKVFREAFETAGLPYFNPHSFRHMLVRYGEQLCKTPEDFKAWSQNLGHEQVLTTFLNYGGVESRRQAEIMRYLGNLHGAVEPDVMEMAKALIQRIKKDERG